MLRLQRMLRDIHEDVDYVNLRSHVRLRIEIPSCVTNANGKQAEEETYDALLIATDSHTRPLMLNRKGSIV
ncbi:hypothetical protein FHL15_010179 [Xylaria flabelliformis]|uniref:Uncharacterized protein n=1 Tax=Xylaria flabelliformis TaxID=2512241 RepID=A0A553HLW7_9PEZI|nr:hypothetical protein FHL15_010179 [Xylaria flabelliformis]